MGHKWIQNVKHVIFDPGKEPLFLDVSSTNIDTLVPSLYQCVETRSIEVFLLGIICDFQMPLGEFLDPVVNRFTRQTLPTINIYLCISFALSPFAHKETRTT
jgi:hypothetical protein